MTTFQEKRRFKRLRIDYPVILNSPSWSYQGKTAEINSLCFSMYTPRQLKKGLCGQALIQTDEFNKRSHQVRVLKSVPTFANSYYTVFRFTRCNQLFKATRLRRAYKKSVFDRRFKYQELDLRQQLQLEQEIEIFLTKKQGIPDSTYKDWLRESDIVHLLYQRDRLHGLELIKYVGIDCVLIILSMNGMWVLLLMQLIAHIYWQHLIHGRLRQLWKPIYYAAVTSTPQVYHIMAEKAKYAECFPKLLQPDSRIPAKIKSLALKIHNIIAPDLPYDPEQMILFHYDRKHPYWLLPNERIGWCPNSQINEAFNQKLGFSTQEGNNFIIIAKLTLKSSMIFFIKSLIVKYRGVGNNGIRGRHSVKVPWRVTSLLWTLKFLTRPWKISPR